MTNTKIIEGNKAIAEFMNVHSVELIKKTMYNFPQLDEYKTIDYSKYHTSWDWLMPVVEKIAEYRLVYPEQCDKVCNCKIVIMKERLYELVVEFITWYNLQPS